ncbi:phospholipase C type enzyme [Ptychographa xylographoides]|nr:phospholipase C type enzyme [Ptychographa xylographoides]
MNASINADYMSAAPEHVIIEEQRQSASDAPYHSPLSSPTGIPASSAPTRLHILSLNCWALKYISDLRALRIAHIAHLISHQTTDPQIVCLQECWTRSDYLTVRSLTRIILPYGKFYHSGCFGGGLVILSKWPIVASSMVRYSLNGRPTAFWRGDWFVGKGVACASIRVPADAASSSIGAKEGEVVASQNVRAGRDDQDHGQLVEIFNTHLHAPYAEPGGADSYACHRTAQAWEIAKLMRAASERGRLVIACGDFNMLPLSLAHRVVEHYGGVSDTWRVLHPDSTTGVMAWNQTGQDLMRKGARIYTADENVMENGTTCDSVLNTWRWSKVERKRIGTAAAIKVEGSSPDPNAKRLDYIFYSNGSEGRGRRWEVENVKVGMMERHPELGCSLSDHFSVEAVFCRVPLYGPQHHRQAQSHSQVLEAEVTTPRVSPSPMTEILSLVATYTTRQRRQRRMLLGHFLISLLVSVACLVGLWWAPVGGVSFVLALVSTLNLSAGVIDGLMGGLFIGSEMRALKEFEWEVRCTIAVEGGEGEGICEDVGSQG